MTVDINHVMANKSGNSSLNDYSKIKYIFYLFKKVWI